MNPKEAAEQVWQNRIKSVRDLISKHPMTIQELRDSIDCSISIIQTVIKQLQSSGANISELPGKRLFLNKMLQPGGSLTLQAKDRGDGWTVIGFITDNHLCNRHSRLDVLEAGYDFFKREGVTDVLNGGNWVDGEARFNRHELIVAPGMDAQLDYAIDVYPQRKGITTHYISGDDHEAWYIHREGINVGQYFQMKAEKAGRQDLKYLGHLEADIKLKCGNYSAVGRLMHPGGGSSYAYSYAPQKIVESFQGGEKPSLLLLGHYHKFEWCYPREVHVVSGGCTTDQSGFMRKNKIAAHVGFSIVKFQQDKYDGHVTRLQVEWIPFYDRKYYEKRFG